MKNRYDFQKAITDEIIASIEAGNVLPWKCPWTRTSESAMPYNWLTKQAYSGINIILLWSAAMSLGYQRNGWLTFKQAQQLGGAVRKGEKGVRCVFAKPVEVANKDANPDEGEPESKVYFCYRPFTLFNLDQIEGLQDLPDLEQPEYSDSEAADAVDRAAETYCANTGVIRRNGGNKAYYSPSLDQIVLPTTFHSGSDYAATLAHEMIHSTGHQSRLNRFDNTTESFKSYHESYAFEELIAELGSAFICSELGVSGQHEQHVSYLDAWLKELKSDKTFIFKAASAASKAHAFISESGAELNALDQKAA